MINDVITWVQRWAPANRNLLKRSSIQLRFSKGFAQFFFDLGHFRL